ncbi:MAG: hypothetical protein Tsb0020_00860 [Haliangiales bacterium]
MSYRDDLEAAKLRRSALADDLQQVRRRIDELEPLKQRAAQLERELEQTGRDLNRARAKVALPLLQRVRVASPCNERWDHMTGDERARHCQRCDKNVYDLSALTTEQAEGLLRAHGESLCVRFYRRQDGTIMTSDCAVGSRTRRRRNRVLAAALATGVAVTGGVAAMMAQAVMVQGEVGITEPSQPTMGAMVLVEADEPVEADELPDIDDIDEMMGEVAVECEADEVSEVRGACPSAVNVEVQ